jgi:transposase InsO family protein
LDGERIHDPQPKQRRRCVVTTNSEHDGSIFPDLAKDVVLDRPNQLWARLAKVPTAKPLE